MINKIDLRIEIGKRVTEIRTKLHMSKNEFARLIGMKNQYLGAVESGKKGLTVERIISICNATGVTADYMLFGVDDKLKSDAQKLLSNYSSEEINKSFDVLKDLVTLTK